MPALDAVLAEPDRAGAPTGSCSPGTSPRARSRRRCLTGCSALGDRVVWVRGNADRELVELARGEADDVGDADRAVGGQAAQPPITWTGWRACRTR